MAAAATDSMRPDHSRAERGGLTTAAAERKAEFIKHSTTVRTKTTLAQQQDSTKAFLGLQLKVVSMCASEWFAVFLFHH